MADPARQLLIHRLRDLVVPNHFADVKDRESHSTRDKDAGVCEVEPRAHASSEPEADGPRVQLCGTSAQLGEEPRRVESLGVAVYPCVVQHSFDVGDDDRAGREVILFVYVVFHELVCEVHRRDRVPPQDFLGDRVDVRQLASVVECGQTIGADHFVDLGLATRDDLGVLC